MEKNKEDKWQELDARRKKIIDEAVAAADRIILNGSDESIEETNFLTAQVAEELVKKALIPIHAAMLKKDLTPSKPE